jgi:hypothetical protein
MRRGSQGVLPMELEAAQGKGAEWRLLGDLLSAGSMFAGTGAGAGLFGEGGTITNMFNPAVMRSSPVPMRAPGRV